MSAPSGGPGRDLPASLPDALRAFSRHASPRLLAASVAAALAARLALGAWSLWDAAAAAALVAWWPVHEWLIHVFILHQRPRRVAGRSLDFKTARLHRAHHLDPWRPELVFIPVHVFAWVPLTFAAAWLAPPALRPPALTALLVYYALSLHYEWLHFLAHTRYRPRSRPYLRLWRNHRLHHFKNERYWYGVTRLGGDRLLGTGPDAAATPTSPTCRSLGFEAEPGAVS